MNITTVATIPDELLQPWLQHLRNFDVAHPGCHFQVRATAGSITTDEMRKVLSSIDPPFAHELVLPRGGE